MEYRRLGRSGLEVSALSLGAWVTYGEQVGEEVAYECMQAARDAGVNFFDNAEGYAKGSPITFARPQSMTHTSSGPATISVGAHALPVYEVYKVGDTPEWVEGLDVFSASGLDLAVVPHWNNTSGGDHDTRFCFMGEPRWNLLEKKLPPSTVVPDKK